MTHQTNKQGFTLIELSIVLVIIGLIVGGVLVGQDLIKAAQVRATVGQIEKYDAAVNTFHGKYNGMPGDLANCTNFFSTDNCSSDTSLIAGNSLLEDTAGTYILFSGEQVMFFNHLYISNLISETASSTVGIDATGTVPMSTTYPAAKIGSNNFIYAYSVGSALTTYPGMAGLNVYRIGGVSDTAASVPTLTNTLTVLEAYQIDTKKDDGVPNTGGVQATDYAGASFNSGTDLASTSYSASTCRFSASVYNTLSSPNTRNCQLVIRGSF